jgi:hypothetical protein
MNDEAARQALHTLVDEPAPPVTTTLDQVLRRGRRRVLAQRAGAVAGVMAVVAAIGVSAVLLRPGDQPDGLQVATSTTTAPSSTVTGPPSTATLQPLDGWQAMRLPTVGCDPAHVQLPPEPQIAILSRDIVEPAFVNAISDVTGSAPAVTMAEWRENSPKQVGPRGYLATEIPMAGGNGQVQLEVIRFGGTPREIADASLATYGNCEPPLRHELADGTILQMYPTNGWDTPAPTRPLQIYRPDNRMYIVTAAGYSQADVTESGGMSGGRGALPLDQQELAQVAVDLVTGLN